MRCAACQVCRRPFDPALLRSVSPAAAAAFSSSSSELFDSTSFVPVPPNDPSSSLSLSGGRAQSLRLAAARFLVDRAVPLCLSWPSSVPSVVGTNSAEKGSSSSRGLVTDNAGYDEGDGRGVGQAEGGGTADTHLLCVASRVLCCIVTGSAGYGLANEDGSSDVDLRGVYAADPRALLAATSDLPSQELALGFPAAVATLPPGAHQPNAETPVPAREHDDVDFTIHELGRELLLLAAGNPFQIEMLFSPNLVAWSDNPSDQPPDAHDVWLDLVRHRRRFLTRRLVREQLSYAFGQLRFQSKMAARGRPVPSKRLYHVPRILFEALRVLRGQDPVVCITEPEELLLLRRIKSGDTPDDVFVALCNSLLEQVENLMDESADSSWRNLPDAIDVCWLNDWLVTVRTRMCM